MKVVKLDLENSTEIEIPESEELKGIFIGRKDKKVISRIVFAHSKPDLKSRINIKAVLYGTSKFDFEGVLKINKGASNTDTYLKIDCLILNDGAMARAIPSLEIKESAVRAGHGATIGYLDQDLIYYLKSKGLTDKQAEDMIVEAFINN